MTIVNSVSKTWAGEPAALKGLIGSVVATILSIYLGQTTTLDGVNAIVATVVAAVVPLVQGLWTRQSVTPVAKVIAPVVTTPAVASAPASTTQVGE